MRSRSCSASGQPQSLIPSVNLFVSRHLIMDPKPIQPVQPLQCALRYSSSSAMFNPIYSGIKFSARGAF